MAFSTQPFRKLYLAHYELTPSNKSFIKTYTQEIVLSSNQNSSLSSDTINLVAEQLTIPTGSNITILSLEYKSMVEHCFADTSLISESLRDLLKNVSNKVFFTLIGIVTLFYAITFILALHRQNPRIRALKKSLNVLTKFDSYSSTKLNQQKYDSTLPIVPSSCSSTITTATSPKQKPFILRELNPSGETLLSIQKTIQPSTVVNEKQCEMTNFINTDENDEQDLPSLSWLRKVTKIKDNDIILMYRTICRMSYNHP